MSIFKTTVLAIALSTAAILPAAADSTPDSTRYTKENMERYMPNARPAATRSNFRGVFLQQRMRADGATRRETPAGFGG